MGSSVFVENWRRVIAFVSGEQEARYWEPEDIQPTDDANNLHLHGFVGEIRDFIASVAEGRKPAADLDDGIAALRLQQAIERSVESGQRVALAEVGDDV